MVQAKVFIIPMYIYLFVSSYTNERLKALSLAFDCVVQKYEFGEAYFCCM